MGARAVTEGRLTGHLGGLEEEEEKGEEVEEREVGWKKTGETE